MSEHVDWSYHFLQVNKHLREVQDLMNEKKYGEAKKKAMDLAVDGSLLRHAITLEEEKWKTKDHR
tara:strand:+ start:1352 stop:1546 length:195 start_codon:yes stop_codon:yes gene_type:complete